MTKERNIGEPVAYVVEANIDSSIGNPMAICGHSTFDRDL
jgi:hypothetical protein